jgi:hypothetical protein
MSEPLRSLAHTRAHACMPHRAVPGWHARSIIGMRDLQAAAARICICEEGRGDYRQILPRAHSHTHAHARLHAPPRCAGMACAEYHRHARSASCCCENMHMRGGEGVIAVRFCSARTRTHTHTRARTLACPPRCAGKARAEYHRHARSASCCCENMRMRGGGGFSVRLSRAHTHTRTHACTPTDEPPGVSRGKPRLPGI